MGADTKISPQFSFSHLVMKLWFLSISTQSNIRNESEIEQSMRCCWKKMSRKMCSKFGCQLTLGPSLEETLTPSTKKKEKQELFRGRRMKEKGRKIDIKHARVEIL